MGCQRRGGSWTQDEFQALIFIESRDSMKKDERAIGLFDSGIGGLTVLKHLISAFPNESFVYLGDTARLPYGTKSAETIERYLIQNVQYLISRDVKAVVVACNSASTVLLRKNLNFTIPVYNVIEPGAQAALQTSVNRRIGVLGTRATVQAEAYVKALKKIDPNVYVVQQACSLLVPLVEEGWEDDPLTNLVIHRYVHPVLDHGIDTLILGCTHYPVLQAGMRRVVGPHIQLIDSPVAIASQLAEDFKTGALGVSSQSKSLQLLSTDASPSFMEVATRLMRPHAIPPLETVDIGTFS